MHCRSGVVVTPGERRLRPFLGRDRCMGLRSLAASDNFCNSSVICDILASRLATRSLDPKGLDGFEVSGFVTALAFCLGRSERSSSCRELLTLFIQASSRRATLRASSSDFGVLSFTFSAKSGSLKALVKWSQAISSRASAVSRGYAKAINLRMSW